MHVVLCFIYIYIKYMPIKKSSFELFVCFEADS